MLMLFPDIGSTGGQAWGVEGDRIFLNHDELGKSMSILVDLWPVHRPESQRSRSG